MVNNKKFFRIHPADAGSQAYRDDYVRHLLAERDRLEKSNAELLAACKTMVDADDPGQVGPAIDTALDAIANARKDEG